MPPSTGKLAIRAAEFGPAERTLLDRVRETVQAIEPHARLILYGSRARGDAARDSDWDLLALVDGPATAARQEVIRERVLALSLEQDASLNVLIFSKEDWVSARLRASPFHANVEEDGVELKPDPSGKGAETSRHFTEIEMTEARADLAGEWLERARVTLREAETLAEDELWNGAVNRLYYACFDAVRALLLARGYRFSKHSTVQSLFNHYFGKTGIAPPELVRLYNTLFESRGEADYTAYARFDAETVRPWLDEATRFVELMDILVNESGAGS